MARKEYNIKFSLKAELAKQFSESFSSAEKSMAALKQEMAELNSTANDIKGYQKQKEQLDKNKAKLSELQKEYQNLQEEEKSSGESSKYLQGKLKKTEQQIEETTKSIKDNEEELDKLGKKLGEAGIDTENLSDETKRLAESYEKLKDKQKYIDELNSSIEKNDERLKKSLGTLGKIAAFDTAAIAAVYKAAIEPSIAFESSFAGVEKTVDGTPEQLAEIKAAVKELSTTIPSTTEEINAVAEAAGQLGIKTDNVISFTETMLAMGVATNMTADEAATNFARFANITKMPQDDFDKLGSAVVDLGNNFATTEAEIVDMGINLAAAGDLTGVSQANIMAIATALSSVGVEAEAGGTAFSKLMKQFAVSDAQDALKQYADVAGMSEEAFKKLYNSNSLSAISAFINGLNDTERNGKSAISILDEMGIKEVRMSNAILSLSNSDDILGKAIELSNTAWKENTALTKEAEKRYETTESKMTMAKNAAENLGVAVGDVLTPKVAEMADNLNESLRDMTAWVEENPELVETMLETAGAIGAVVTGYAAMKVGVLAVKKVVLDCKKIFAVGGGFGVAAAAGVAAFAALTAAIKYNNDEYQKLRQEYLDNAFFDNGGAKLSDFTEALQDGTQESKVFAERINMTADEVKEIKTSIANARNEIKMYGGSLKEDAILTPEEAEALQGPFMELGELLEQDFTVKYSTVFDAFKLAASEVADSLGADISEIEVMLDSFKNRYTGELTKSQSVVNELLERQSNGETLTDEDYEKLREEVSFYNDITAQQSEALYSYNQTVDSLGRIDLGANQDEAIANLKALKEYADEYLNELDTAQEQLNKYFDDERQKNQTMLEYGKISQEEYDNYSNAIDIAQGITYESYLQNRSDFQKQVREQTDAIADMIDEEVKNAVDEKGLSVWDFLTGTQAVDSDDFFNGNFSKEQYRYARASAENSIREIYKGITGEVNNLNKTMDIPPIYIPLEVLETTNSYISKAALSTETPHLAKPSQIAAYAGGTDYSEDTFIAGEYGPELITGARGRKVFTAAETAHISENIANMGSSVSVSVNIPSVVMQSGNSEELQEQFEIMAQSIAVQVERAISERAMDNRRMEY